MWFQLSSIHLVTSAVLLPACQAFSVTATNDANTLASAIFGDGITVLQAAFSGAAISSGTFTDGPFGIGNGGILTSGAAVGALPNGNHYVNNGAPGSDTYCGPNTFNAALLTVDILVGTGFSGLRVEAILASEEEGGSADPVGIFLNSQQYARDPSGNRLTATSPWLAAPLGIRPPNSVTSYPGSTPPFWIDILTQGAQTMVIAICDQSDAEWDSGLLLNVEACTDCDPEVRLAYVTTTTTLAAGEATFTSTTAASGTVSGTIRIGVAPEETTTTTAEETTTTAADTTTTAEETTTTAEEATTTTADETTTTAAETTTTTVSEETTTTAEEVTTTTADEITTTTAVDTTTTTAIETATTEETTVVTTSDGSTTTTAQDTTTDASTDSSTTAETSEELPGTTTTTLATSDTTTQSSLIVTESTSDTVIDRKSTTTSSSEVEIPSIISTVSTTTVESTESLSSDISTLDTRVPITDTTAIVESSETTTAQETEPSTDLDVPSLTQSADATSSTAVTSPFEDASTTTALATATSSATPSNLPLIGTFRFEGCLGSPDGYPSFELIGEGPDMTTEECVRLGTGRAYIGIYLRSCYAADTLDSAERVATGRCDLPCPGDPGLFCGGEIDTFSIAKSRFMSRKRLDRRDAPADILLTLYAETEAISGSLTTSNVPSTVDATTDNFPISTAIPTVPTTQPFIDSVITIDPSVPFTQTQGGRPIIPPFPTSAGFGNFTRTEVIAPITTTMTYTVVDPNDPSRLTVTQFCTTLVSPPCRQCQYQKPPTVAMTTIKVDCNACGHYGENTIILDVPVGAMPAAPTRIHSGYPADHHEPSPHEQKPRPLGNGGYKFGQPQVPQDKPTGAGHGQEESEPAEVVETEPKPKSGGGSSQPEPVKPHQDHDEKFDQPQIYHHEPIGAGDSHREDNDDIEPKPKPLGGNGQPEPLEPTFQRRPGPASTPAVPNTPIVVVSGATSRTWEEMLLATFFINVLVFIL
ncbi:hypothetical protein NW768_009996 [Fusarium equiseti]|uniref:WSC domain-containing protein n=1 Tax=Fusarium equiseti TaxID=61235 RepID=A0ABQ8R1B8_FUSEQ|nr:hypothetical protein NW768_009996 [Fusarium equiseti]